MIPPPAALAPTTTMETVSMEVTTSSATTMETVSMEVTTSSAIITAGSSIVIAIAALYATLKLVM